MPIRPGRLLLAAIIGLPLGALLAAFVGWWALAGVTIGKEPIFGRLHVREGTAFVYARAHDFGVEYVNLERLPQPLTNRELNWPDVPAWAEPIDPEPPPGKWQVGTLAVGWPRRAVLRQWNERELERGFLPQVELDDDGTTMRRAADRFFDSAPSSHMHVLAGGALVNVVVFALPATVLLYLLLGWMHASRRGDHSAGSRGSRI